ETQKLVEVRAMKSRRVREPGAIALVGGNIECTARLLERRDIMRGNAERLTRSAMRGCQCVVGGDALPIDLTHVLEVCAVDLLDVQAREPCLLAEAFGRREFVPEREQLGARGAIESGRRGRRVRP